MPIALNRKQRIEILACIRKRVLKHHFNVAGVSYDAWMRLLHERTSDLLAADTDGFENGVRQLMLELGSSHTGFYHQRAARVLPQHALNATLRSFRVAGDEQWIFLDVFQDGPADIAGIKPGDVLLAVNKISYLPPSMPPFQLGQTYELTISNPRGENARKVVINVPHKKGTKKRPPFIEPKSLTHGMLKRNIGVLRIAYFPGEMGMTFAKQLDGAIADLKNRGSDHLIVDLRGCIGGGLGLARLASYLCPGQIPIGHNLTPKRRRTGYEMAQLPPVPMPRGKLELLFTLARFLFRDKSVVLLTQGLGPQPFHNKVVLITNEWTNSAAEMVVSFAAESGLATIVGRKTAGNVLGALNFTVGCGYWVRLPVFGWYTPQGNCLDGKGVPPDVEVEVDPQLLNAGIDQQMDKAIEVLHAPKTIRAPAD